MWTHKSFASLEEVQESEVIGSELSSFHLSVEVNGVQRIATSGRASDDGVPHEDV